MWYALCILIGIALGIALTLLCLHVHRRSTTLGPRTAKLIVEEVKRAERLGWDITHRTVQGYHLVNHDDTGGPTITYIVISDGHGIFSEMLIIKRMDVTRVLKTDGPMKLSQLDKETLAKARALMHMQDAPSA